MKESRSMTTTTPRPTRARFNFAVFSLGAVGAGWLGVALDQASGVDLANGVALSNSSGTTGQAVFILGPALLALGLYRFSRDGAGPLGFTLQFPHRARWFGIAAVLYPAITVVVVGTGLATGMAALSASASPGKPAYLNAFLMIFAIQVVKNIVEEFIFRGYGTRTAMALGLRGAALPHLLVGVVWALWHLPLYLMWTSDRDLRLITSLPWPLFLPLLVVGVVATSLVYGELRIQTGSIWPGVLLHTMCNAVATPLLAHGHLTFRGHGDVLASPVPSAIATMLLFGVTGLFLLRRRMKAVAQSTPAPREPIASDATAR
jgi:membrane protease YdiL (CAAX protease family)